MNRRRVYAGLAALDTVLATLPRAVRWRRVTKAALMPTLALAVPPRTPAAALALAGSWVGDVALLARSRAGLAGGMAGFAGAHLAYLAAMRDARRRHERDEVVGWTWTARDPSPAPYAPVGPVVALLAAGAVAELRWALPRVEPALRPAVLGYGALVLATATEAVRTGFRIRGPVGPTLGQGGIAFLVSDGLVAWTLFGDRVPAWARGAVMATYTLAQAWLLRSLDRLTGR